MIDEVFKEVYKAERDKAILEKLKKIAEKTNELNVSFNDINCNDKKMSKLTRDELINILDKFKNVNKEEFYKIYFE